MDKGRLVSQGHVDEVLTPENIRNVYGLHALVKRHPLTGCIYTLPVSTELALERAPGLGRIHVVGGGGSASYLMRFLHEAGYNVSTGVVNVFDADLEAASLFGISAVVEAPFSPITPDSYKENLSLMVECCAVVVSETPFGGGNLLNLEAVLEAQRKGSIAVVLMNGVSITERDYTGGRATGLFQLLLDNGAGLAANLRVLEQILARVCPDSP